MVNTQNHVRDYFRLNYQNLMCNKCKITLVDLQIWSLNIQNASFRTFNINYTEYHYSLPHFHTMSILI